MSPAPSPSTESAHRLRARIHSVPATLRAALDVLTQASNELRPLGSADGPVWVTGGGMSEGPARYLVALLTARGVLAEYVPLSEFVATEIAGSQAVGPSAHRAGTLVLFSQGLAPNARFPLLHTQRFRRSILLTSVTPTQKQTAGQPGTADFAAAAQARGVQVLTLPPPDEEGLLLRVVGPAVQALAAAWLAGVLWADLQRVPSVYTDVLDPDLPPDLCLRVGDDLPPVALIASGRYASACFGLRWKLLEGLQLPDPPIWDLLQVAHGPLQSIWQRPQTLVLLTRAAAPHEAALQAALMQVFQPPRHRVLSLAAHALPGLLAYFEHDAQLNRLVHAALESDSPRSPAIDLIDWPGRGFDGPLYGYAPTSADLLHVEQASDPPRDTRPAVRSDPDAQGSR